MALCFVTALSNGLSWPLYGDEVLFHYAVFLIRSGQAPYTQVVDINLPGSYALDAFTMSIFGAGANGLRIYDGFLSLLTCSAMASLGEGSCERYGRIAGLASGLFFCLLHLYDGVAQVGQRDFAMTALALLGCAALSRQRPVDLWLFEVLVGMTLTIKPTLLPLAFAPLLFSSFRRSPRFLAPALAGLFTAPILVICWLAHFNAVHDCFQTLRTLGALHSSIGRRSTAYLLSRITSPIATLLILWLVMVLFNKRKPVASEALLAFAAVCGLLSYIVQGKGHPYQRYPFLAFVLLLLAATIARSMAGGLVSRTLALTTTVIACLWFAPRFSHTVSMLDLTTLSQTALANQIRALDVFTA